MDIPEELLSKFPVLIREKLKAKEIRLPDETKFNYEPILGYRTIKRKPSDNTTVSRDDFMSHAELGRKIKGIEHPELLPEYYGASLFYGKKELEVRQKLPKKGIKIAIGNIVQEGGPCLVNNETTHVCWWLYKNIEIDGFKILED